MDRAHAGTAAPPAQARHAGAGGARVFGYGTLRGDPGRHEAPRWLDP